MSRIKSDIKSEKIVDYIKKTVKIMNCHDITDDFKYDGVFVYDCKINTSSINLAMVDENENIDYKRLKDIDASDYQINELISVILKNLENDISFEYSLDNLNIFFDTYTFFDYSNDIKFIMVLDFLNHSYSSIKPMKTNIIKKQLSGNSKFLN